MSDIFNKIAVQSRLIAREYNGFDRTMITPNERRFAHHVVRHCIQFIEEENVRLCEYQNSLAESDVEKRRDCDLVIEKCIDLAERMKDHFGVKDDIL